MKRKFLISIIILVWGMVLCIVFDQDTVDNGSRVESSVMMWYLYVQLRDNSTCDHDVASTSWIVGSSGCVIHLPAVGC